jgi:TPP-dependent pyruvate/acetoin dehydrogenase alpha subunit
MTLTKEQLRDAYKCMAEIRAFEERLHKENQTGEIPGFLHLYAGEEAIAAGVCMHLEDRDYIVSTHRGHGHCIAKGCDIKAMMKELYAKVGGLCGGKGGSMHIADLSKGMLGANGIVGAGSPLALGAALSAKTRKTRNVSVAFAGDGAANQGTTFEAMHFAVVLKLPVVFVFENNGYGEFTGHDYAGAGREIAARAGAFGMPAERVDGTDLFAVAKAAGEAISRARNGEGPSAIEATAPRYFGHFEGDPQGYRSKEELHLARSERDCLKIFREKVLKGRLLDKAMLDKIDQDAAALVDAAVAEARAAPSASVETLLTDVYVSY